LLEKLITIIYLAGKALVGLGKMTD
jgi:hypothetical protein